MAEVEKESSNEKLSKDQIEQDEKTQEDFQKNGEQIFNQEMFEELAKQKNYNALAKIAEKDKTQFKIFKRLKWKGQLYQINESIRVNFQDTLRIGIIKRITSIKSFIDNQELPLLQLNWYYSKMDLDSQWERYMKCFSEYELFLTEISDFIFIGQIIDKVKVLSLNEYDSFLDDDISGQNRLFFMRCTYNSEKKSINPNLNELEKVCFCEMPQNPDLVYIFCESCKKWLHMDCVHLTEDEAKNIEEYICVQCNK
ncbi:unnamed protein product [Paramecium octaurelia]|uniref:PHD-type domain-containing protein n=1 Tax=Paramecium octaurelia TaxID=43137 RepID=A0A8S1WVB1_PAROT|nr:unnamed protein product [Paramecium octaurelia]